MATSIKIKEQPIRCSTAGSRPNPFMRSVGYNDGLCRMIWWGWMPMAHTDYWIGVVEGLRTRRAEKLAAVAS